MLIIRVSLGSVAFDAVYALYRQHSATLGFFPMGVFEELAHAGQIIAATVNDRVVGYLAYRRSGPDAAISMFCVAREHRGNGVARALMERLVADVADVAAIRLTCRRDYPATALWPRLHFVQQGADRPGRGKDAGALVRWVRDVRPQPSLMDLMQVAHVANRRIVAMDANVFFDLDEDTARGEESKALMGDWLEDEIALCVTAELHNEIGFARTPEQQARSRSRATNFPTLRGEPDCCGEVRERLRGVLPDAVDRQDEADRRQLAHAICMKAWAFTTRDGALLDHADEIESAFGVRVLRPVDALLAIQSEANPSAYQPARLAGSHIVFAALGEDMRAGVEVRFHRAERGERRADWLNRFRGALCATACDVVAVSAREQPPVLVYALDRGEAGILNVRLLRSVSDSLASTLLRRVLAEAVTTAQAEGRSVVRCEDGGSPAVDAALADVGFTPGGATWERHTLRGVVPFGDLVTATHSLPQAVRAVVADAGPGDCAAVERRFWPLKVTGGGTRTFVIPIQPHWAAELFDADLADRGLFGAAAVLALALENVYYSGSKNTIPPGSRILWYVSKNKSSGHHQVRACSICEETCKGSAHSLAARFRRLGVFRWDDILKVAKDDPLGQATAYRFSHTERFTTPVPWRTFQTLHHRHVGCENRIQGPTSIPEAVFADVYRMGMSLG